MSGDVILVIVIATALVGSGAAKRLSAVRWGVAGNIAAAWTLTLPAAGAFGALVYWLQSGLGAGVLGPTVIWVLAIAALSSVILRRRTRVAPVPEAS